jgi:hypothetical protein
LYGIIEQEEVGCNCTKRRAQCVTGIRDREDRKGTGAMEEGRDGEEANGENSEDGGNSNSSSRCNGSDIISFQFMQKVYMRACCRKK